jgi:hypothetical protein
MCAPAQGIWCIPVVYGRKADLFKTRGRSVLLELGEVSYILDLLNRSKGEFNVELQAY